MTLQWFRESHVNVYFSDIIDIERLCRIFVDFYACCLRNRQATTQKIAATYDM